MKYVVGCDGGNSFTRKHIDAKYEGSTFKDQPWIVVDTKVKDKEWFRENTWEEGKKAGLRTCFVADPIRPTVVVNVRMPYRS